MVTRLDRALSSTPRPNPAGPVAASIAFAWRAATKIRRVPEQLGDVIMVPVISTLLFTYLFGGAVAGSTGAYLEYLLPGILVQTVLLVTVFSGVVLHTSMKPAAAGSNPLERPIRPGSLVADINIACVSGTHRRALAAQCETGLLTMTSRPEHSRDIDR